MIWSISRTPGRRRWAAAGAAVAISVATFAVTGPSDGAQSADRPTTRIAGRSGEDDARLNYDARLLAGDRLARARTKQVRTTGKAVTALRRQLGPGANIDINPLTGTPDQVSARTALTSASNRGAASVALGFVRAHLAAFGLDRADLNTLVKVRQYRDLNGITHVYWVQQVAGTRRDGDRARAEVRQRDDRLEADLALARDEPVLVGVRDERILVALRLLERDPIDHQDRIAIDEALHGVAVEADDEASCPPRLPSPRGCRCDPPKRRW